MRRRSYRKDLERISKFCAKGLALSIAPERNQSETIQLAPSTNSSAASDTSQHRNPRCGVSSGRPDYPVWKGCLIFEDQALSETHAELDLQDLVGKLDAS